MSSRPVFFPTCLATHRQVLGPTVPREKCLILAILPSPAVPQSPDADSHRWSLTFSYYFSILPLYAFVLSTTVLFPVFPCPSFFSILTQFGLIRSKIEIQLSGYDGWIQGCRITMVDCIKAFLYIIAGSCAREDFRNHGDAFRPLSLFSR